MQDKAARLPKGGRAASQLQSDLNSTLWERYHGRVINLQLSCMLQAEPEAPMPILSSEHLQTLALYAQGLCESDKPNHDVAAAELLNTIRRLVGIQIDTINVLQRSPYLTLWSRLGPFRTELLDGLHQEGDLFEYWLHAACLIPTSEYRFRLPVMREYREKGDRWYKEWLIVEENKKIMSDLRDRIHRDGPMSASMLDGKRAVVHGWSRQKVGKVALEQLYNRGELMVCKRKVSNYERVFDIPERVLRRSIDRRAPSVEEMLRHYIERSILALGACLLKQIPDYLKLPRSQTARLINELTSEGVIVSLTEISPRGKERTWLTHSQLLPVVKAIQGEIIKPERTTLIGPFDNLFWVPSRIEILWEFKQVFEGYKPPAKRQYGYYSLAILDRGKLIGRLDPKLDRATSTLMIQQMSFTQEISETQFARIANAIKSLCTFVHADRISLSESVADKGVGDFL